MISVVVPIFNAYAYLYNCIKSIINQEYRDIEVILVDDGSKDESSLLCDDFAFLNSKISIIHQKNHGVTTARISGIKITLGDWIGFVDADDEIEPDMYERLIKNAMDYDADVSHCGYQTIVNGGERIHYFYNTGKTILQNHSTGIKDLLEGKKIEPGLWNKIYKKELFYSIIYTEIMDRSIVINEDLLMNTILFSQSKSSVFEDFCPYHYLVRKTSVTRSKKNISKIMGPVKVWEWILNYVDPDLVDLARKKWLTSCMSAYHSLLSMDGFEKEKQMVKTSLFSNRNEWKNLSRNEKIKVHLITKWPKLYLKTYQLYEKYFQNKVYE